jgi:hypothetical protein
VLGEIVAWVKALGALSWPHDGAVSGGHSLVSAVELSGESYRVEVIDGVADGEFVYVWHASCPIPPPPAMLRWLLSEENTDAKDC